MTEKFLNEAFAGESMAHMKYQIFSEIAEKEGFQTLQDFLKLFLMLNRCMLQIILETLGI